MLRLLVTLGRMGPYPVDMSHCYPQAILPLFLYRFTGVVQGRLYTEFCALQKAVRDPEFSPVSNRTKGDGYRAYEDERLPRRSRRGVWWGMAYLPMQKLEKIRPRRSSALNSPVISPNAC